MARPPTDRSMSTPAIESPATGTAPPPSTPTTALDLDTPTEPTSEVRPDIREFVDGLCAAYFSGLPRETWGELAIWTQTFIQDLQSLETPEEFERMFTALQEQNRLRLDFARGQDPNEPAGPDQIKEFEESAEWKALEESYQEEKRAVDPDILAALDEC